MTTGEPLSFVNRVSVLLTKKDVELTRSFWEVSSQTREKGKFYLEEQQNKEHLIVERTEPIITYLRKPALGGTLVERFFSRTRINKLFL